MYRRIYLTILLAIMLISCATTQLAEQENRQVAFVTVHHSILQIPENATYQWSDGFLQHKKSGLISDVDLWKLLKQGIEQEMLNKGYKHISDADHADLNISFIAALTSTLGDEEIANRYGLVPGLMVHNADKNHYEKGTLIFDVVNPKTNQLAWRTAGQALATLTDIPLDERKARIDFFVKKLLAFLPEK